MAVAIDATGTSANLSATSPASYTGLTVGSSLSNSALIFIVDFICNASTGAGTVTALWDFGGTAQSMTNLGNVINTTSLDQVVMFGLLNPTAGNKTLQVTWTGSVVALTVIAVSMTGVTQTSVAAAFANFTSSATTSSINVTSATGDMVFAGVTADATLSGPNGTQLFNVTNVDQLGANRAAASAGSTTMSWTSTTNRCIAGVDVVAAASTLNPPTDDEIFQLITKRSGFPAFLDKWGFVGNQPPAATPKFLVVEESPPQFKPPFIEQSWTTPSPLLFQTSSPPGGGPISPTVVLNRFVPYQMNAGFGAQKPAPATTGPLTFEESPTQFKPPFIERSWVTPENQFFPNAVTINFAVEESPVRFNYPFIERSWTDWDNVQPSSATPGPVRFEESPPQYKSYYFYDRSWTLWENKAFPNPPSNVTGAGPEEVPIVYQVNVIYQANANVVQSFAPPPVINFAVEESPPEIKASFIERSWTAFAGNQPPPATTGPLTFEESPPQFKGLFIERSWTAFENLFFPSTPGALTFEESPVLFKGLFTEKSWTAWDNVQPPPATTGPLTFEESPPQFKGLFIERSWSAWDNVQPPAFTPTFLNLEESPVQFKGLFTEKSWTLWANIQPPSAIPGPLTFEQSDPLFKGPFIDRYWQAYGQPIQGAATTPNFLVLQEWPPQFKGLFLDRSWTILATQPPSATPNFLTFEEWPPEFKQAFIDRYSTAYGQPIQSVAATPNFLVFQQSDPQFKGLFIERSWTTPENLFFPNLPPYLTLQEWPPQLKSPFIERSWTVLATQPPSATPSILTFEEWPSEFKQAFIDRYWNAYGQPIQGAATTPNFLSFEEWPPEIKQVFIDRSWTVLATQPPTATPSLLTFEEWPPEIKQAFIDRGTTTSENQFFANQTTPTAFAFVGFSGYVQLKGIINQTNCFVSPTRQSTVFTESPVSFKAAVNPAMNQQDINDLFQAGQLWGYLSDSPVLIRPPVIDRNQAGVVSPPTTPAAQTPSFFGWFDYPPQFKSRTSQNIVNLFSAEIPTIVLTVTRIKIYSYITSSYIQ